VELTVNGIGQRLPGELTVADLVERITGAHQGVAVAVNGEVVPRGGWPTRQLRDGDRVEVLTAAQGG
jgi:sulfur carrier protein